jgi:hypothetical protein
MPLRNVAVPAGDIYPNGLPHNLAPGDIQSTVRPQGWLFRHSAGYLTVRAGKTDFQDGQHGGGIHFTPQRFAEDVGSVDGHGYPLMVDKAKAVDMVDLADLPGSERLDDDGTITPYEAAGNRGVMLSDSSGAPVGGRDIRESERTIPDMGDRQLGRPITQARRLLMNPSSILHADYQKNPINSVLSAAFVVGVFYLIGSNLEQEFNKRRRGSSGTGAVGAAAAAPVAASGATVRQAADVADRSVSAAGDAVADAGKAVEKVSDAVADVVKD